MHMARLWDTTRDKVTGSITASGVGKQGYSLEALSEELIADHSFAKISMKDLFGISRENKDGSVSKRADIPDIMELQTNPLFRDKWIRYSAKDALATWWVRDALMKKLTAMPWVVNNDNSKTLGNLFQFYEKYLVDFGNCLTDMVSVW